MNASAIQAILALILQFLPKITDSAAITNIINVLVQWMPVIFQFFKDQIPTVQTILAVLRADPHALPDQIASIDAMSAQCDAAFDAAVADALAADRALAGS